MNTHDRTHRAWTFNKVSEKFQLSFHSLFLLVSLRCHFIERNAKTHMRTGESNIRANLSVSIHVKSFSLFIQAES